MGIVPYGFLGPRWYDAIQTLNPAVWTPIIGGDSCSSLGSYANWPTPGPGGAAWAASPFPESAPSLIPSEADIGHTCAIVPAAQGIIETGTGGVHTNLTSLSFGLWVRSTDSGELVRIGWDPTSSVGTAIRSVRMWQQCVGSTVTYRILMRGQNPSPISWYGIMDKASITFTTSLTNAPRFITVTMAHGDIDTMELYIDGALVATSPIDAGFSYFASFTSGATASIEIGANLHAGITPSGGAPGAYDDFILARTRWGASTVASLFESAQAPS